jgi:hypothetical protein
VGVIEIVRVTEGVIDGVLEAVRVHEGDLVDDLDCEAVFVSETASVHGRNTANRTTSNVTVG